MANTFEMTGKHLILCYKGCDTSALLNIEETKKQMFAAIKAVGAEALSCVEHVFQVPGQPGVGGYTLLVQLCESHASYHSYPEHCGVFLDLFCCGTQCDVSKFDQAMSAYLKPQQKQSQLLLRQ